MADVAVRRPRMNWAVVVAAAVVLAAGTAFGLLVFRSQQLPDGVVPVAWDRTVCAHCRMHVGEPGFAAQAQLKDGQVLNFDDPGCLLQWMDKNQAPLHAAYVHHHKADRWLPLAQAGFVHVMPTPMGFGLGAVDANTSDAITVEKARVRVRGDHTNHGDVP